MIEQLEDVFHEWHFCEECGDHRECLVHLFQDGAREIVCETCRYAWLVEEPLEDKPAPL